MNRLVDRGHRLTQETLSIVVGVNFVSAAWLVTNMCTIGRGFKTNLIDDQVPGKGDGTSLGRKMQLAKQLLVVLWFAFITARLDWDVACFHQSYKDCVTRLVTDKTFARELEVRGHPATTRLAFLTRLTQIHLAGKLPGYRVFGMPITKGMLVRFSYAICAGAVSMYTYLGRMS